jgi:hypothetical protein
MNKNSHEAMNAKDNGLASRRQFLRQAAPLAAVTLGCLVAEATAAADTAAPQAATVATMAALRQLAAPAHGELVYLAGYHKPGDGGGGAFAWDAHYQPGPDNLADDGGTHILPQGSAPNTPGRWRRTASGPLNVKWFGALGDDTGATPAGSGMDINNAPWNNNWPKSIQETRPLHTAKFANDDSWDYIGIQMASLSAATHGFGDVYVPAGLYRLSQHLLFTMNLHATLTGAGMYQTILTKTKDQFKNSFLIRIFDTGGAPTTIRDLCLMGPTDAQSQHNHQDVNFTLVLLNHTNGIHFENCWFTSCHLALYFALATDCYVTNCTAEYCGTTIKTEPGTDLNVLGCNFWQSAPAEERYNGIENAGDLHCVNSRFVGYQGYAIQCKGGSLHAVGNYFVNFTQAVVVVDAAQAARSVISGNRIIGGSLSPMISVGQDSLVTSNYLEQQGEHACIDLTANKTNINVSGNVICCKPADKKIVEGGLIISVSPGVSFNSGCADCLIMGNTFNQPDSINVDSRRNHIVNNLMGGKV